MTFDPTSVEVTLCNSTQGSLCPSGHENTSKYVDTVNLFAKTWTKGHWPLDDLWPYICWGHMCDSTQGSLCPSPMKIHQKLCENTVNVFAKTWTNRSLTPRWPYDPTSVEVTCVTLPKDHCVQCPMGIHQCMRIQWSILQKLPHTYTYILHTHTTYRISDHIVSFWTTFRRDKNFYNVSQLWL